METQNNKHEYLQEEYIANMMKKNEETFVEVAYEIINSLEPAYNMDDTISASKNVAEILSQLYKNTKSDEEKAFVQKIIGFLALEPEIHMGEYYEEKNNDYLSGYSAPLNIEELLKRGKDIVNGDDSFPLSINYFDGDQVDEQKYFKVLGIGKDEIEFVEISQDDFVEERWHHERKITPEEAAKNALKVTSTDKINEANYKEQLELNQENARGGNQK